MLNKFVLQGRFVKAPKKKILYNNKPVCNFTIAWNSKGYKYFQDCVVWAPEIIDLIFKFKQGDMIIVSGFLFLQQWEYRGERRQKKILNVQEVHFCGSYIEVEEQEEKEDIPSDEEIENLPW